MTRDDIIRLALEHFGAVLKPSDLEVKLAVLAVAAEREACAKICDELRPSKPEYDQRFHDGCTISAAAIRARSKV